MKLTFSRIHFSRKQRRRAFYISCFLVVLMVYYSILPSQLFDKDISIVIEDQKGNLLGAHIADDGQWRFPPLDSIPDKFRQSAITFEDKRFDYHWGFDPLALVRALVQNIRAGGIESGGSTITMQVIRLSRNKSRTIFEKIIEIILASRLEFSYSKKEIFTMYASNAPFGGNVVGIDAAAWRYFNRSPFDLSWAESAMLAVLPNSPALIHPGKNRKHLFAKRNRLLRRLYENGTIDSLTYQLSIEEPIPEQPKPYPQIAPHVLSRMYSKRKRNKQSRIKTTIDADLQKQVIRIIDQYHKKYSVNSINNIAALVLDVESGEVLAYVGNVHANGNQTHSYQVDMIPAERSTGSILKPFLYAGMLTSGEILPTTLIADVPTNLGGYSPQNYNLSYDGAVPARRALARSLNVPAVRLLMDYSVERFHYLLQKIGMTTLHYPPDHYGLSLILGGCEGSLWDISGIYASMARTLNHYTVYNGKYNRSDFHPPVIRHRHNPAKGTVQLDDNSWFSASAIWITYQAMLDVERPTDESNWELFSSSRRIAWKTGTSFGFRDAWSIGVTPRFVVGVWVGNADGEGRPDLIGIKAAAPVLFDIFDLLPQKNSWFDPPYDDMIYEAICGKSGYLASEICAPMDSMWIPKTGERFKVCPFHKLIHLDSSETWRVDSECENPENMVHKPWFVLPPAMEWFYKSKNANYKTLPPYREDCKHNFSAGDTRAMEIIYPKETAKIYVPVELDGSPGSTVFEVAHRRPNTIIFWHIDKQYIGQTRQFHQMALHPPKGKHTLSLVDEYGETLTLKFEIMGKEDNNS